MTEPIAGAEAPVHHYTQAELDELVHELEYLTAANKARNEEATRDSLGLDADQADRDRVAAELLRQIEEQRAALDAPPVIGSPASSGAEAPAATAPAEGAQAAEEEAPAAVGDGAPVAHPDQVVDGDTAAGVLDAPAEVADEASS